MFGYQRAGRHAAARRVSGRKVRKSASFNRRGLTLVGSVVLLSMVGAGLAIASHGDDIIDLTTADAIELHDGARFVQGGVGAGTGTFDPFLQVQETGGGADGIERGYNTEPVANGEFDTKSISAGNTHTILVSAVPTLEVAGVLYREFSLDAKDTGSDAHMSIDELKLFTSTTGEVTDYNEATETFAGSTVTKIYDLDATGDVTILMATQGLEPGSGVSDITVLIPDSIFPAGCDYGNPTCNQFLIFWTVMGGYDNPDDERDFDADSGFEEWRVRKLPVVTVTKTAVPTFDRTFDWTVTKQVSIDGGTTWVDAATVDLFDGDSAGYLWQITVDKSDPIDGNPAVTGEIVITNPTGADEPIPAIIAEVNSVTDVISDGINATVECPVTFPATLDPGESITCTYSSPLPDTGARTNTATVNIDDGTGGTKDYTGTADIDFTSVTPTTTDDSATLDDTVGGLSGTFSADTTVTSEASQNAGCPDDSGIITNTATLTESDSGTVRQDSATLAVNCHELTVTKDATESFGRTFDWSVEKEVSEDGGTTWVDAATIDLFDGQSSSVLWKISVTKGAAIDTGFAVAGTITVSNPAPMIAEDVLVSDTLPGAVGLVVDCDPGAGVSNTVDVPARAAGVDGLATCDYSATLPDGSTRTNTATATLFGEDYTGTASVDFTGVDPTVTDDSAELEDDLAGLSGNFNDSGSVTSANPYPVGCPDDEGALINTATLTESDSGTEHTDPASVTVNCHGLTVEKTATATYTRTFDWTVKKYVTADDTCAAGLEDDTLNVGLFVGESETVCWKIVADRGPEVDSDFKVTGTITITNNAPIAANDVAVSDSLAGPVAATVDCDPGAGTSTTVDVAANGGTAECAYEASVADATDRLNTATATLAGVDYTGSALADFGEPTTVIDESASLDDDRNPVGFPENLSDDATRTYTEVLTCGDTRTESNTALLTESDTGTQRTDSAAVALTCTPVLNEGCTPGYWKNHPESWQVYTTSQTLEEVFDVPDGFGLDSDSLLAALGYPGGPGLGGAAQNLLRAAVAAVLNSAHADVDYPLTTAEVISQVNVALAGTRPAMLTLAATLDANNNLGCPLGNTSNAGVVILLATSGLGTVLGLRGGKHLRNKR